MKSSTHHFVIFIVNLEQQRMRPESLRDLMTSAVHKSMAAFVSHVQRAGVFNQKRGDWKRPRQFYNVLMIVAKQIQIISQYIYHV